MQFNFNFLLSVSIFYIQFMAIFCLVWDYLTYSQPISMLKFLRVYYYFTKNHRKCTSQSQLCCFSINPKQNQSSTDSSVFSHANYWFFAFDSSSDWSIEVFWFVEIGQMYRKTQIRLARYG